MFLVRSPSRTHWELLAPFLTVSIARPRPGGSYQNHSFLHPFARIRVDRIARRVAAAFAGHHSIGTESRSSRSPNRPGSQRRKHTSHGAAIPHIASTEYFPAPVMYNSKKPPMMLRSL